jgi:acyl CoA:acetate/3-ketoacid CoA transferase beta subunit
MADVSRADICVVACADAWRGDGELLASPIGPIPAMAARLARAVFEPDLLLIDGEATLVRGTWAVGTAPDGPPEGWLPYRAVFDLVWRGRRHIMMGPSQIDRYGNANISCIGDFAKPKVQLLGVRGAPGNTVNHPVSYWVPKHSPRVFVDRVDMVSGVGYDRAAESPAAGRYLDLRRVVSNLGVFDFGGPDHRLRIVSVHPGVTVDDIATATGFELAVADDLPETRRPTAEELDVLDTVIDPDGTRHQQIAS